MCVVKCRGASCDPSGEVPDEGSMTGLTVTDRETGKSVTIPLSAMEEETGILSLITIAYSFPGQVVLN